VIATSELSSRRQTFNRAGLATGVSLNLQSCKPIDLLRLRNAPRCNVHGITCLAKYPGCGVAFSNSLQQNELRIAVRQRIAEGIPQ
jgi:hypothetical protein